MRLPDSTDKAGPDADGSQAAGFVGATCIDFCRVRPEGASPHLHTRALFTFGLFQHLREPVEITLFSQRTLPLFGQLRM
jgi:hypothetical protein